MLDFYYWPTPNGWKVAILLEELGLDYTTHPVNIGKGDQFKPAFLKISPNNRMPAIVDHDVEGEPISVFESGAIMFYLAEINRALYRRAVLDQLAPASNVGEGVQRGPQRFGDQHPGPGDHIANRVVVAEDIRPTVELALQHPDTAVIFIGVAGVRIRVFAGRIIDEMAELAGHRPLVSGLPE